MGNKSLTDYARLIVIAVSALVLWRGEGSLLPFAIQQPATAPLSTVSQEEPSTTTAKRTPEKQATSPTVTPLTQPPTATPPLPTPTTPPWKLVLEDDFSDPANGWPKDYTDNDVEMGYEKGEYRIVVKRAQVGYFVPLEAEYSNITLEVEARHVSGPDSTYGLTFRHQDSDNAYVFLISSTGSYGLFKRVQGKWIALQKLAKTPYLNRGSKTNRLKVVCVGSRITVYINDRYITSVTDTSFTTGHVGLRADASDESGTQTHFDNLKVYSDAPVQTSTATPEG